MCIKQWLYPQYWSQPVICLISVGSWFISPVLAGMVSTSLFYLCKYFILSKVNWFSYSTGMRMFCAFTVSYRFRISPITSPNTQRKENVVWPVARWVLTIRDHWEISAQHWSGSLFKERINQIKSNQKSVEILAFLLASCEPMVYTWYSAIT